MWSKNVLASTNIILRHSLKINDYEVYLYKLYDYKSISY